MALGVCSSFSNTFFTSPLVILMSDFFIFFACTAGAASIILLCLCPMLNRMMKPVMVFATNNSNKLREAKQILGKRFEILSLKDINCFEELPETHLTLEENSLEKARYVNQHYGYDCFADDTGLEVEALNGEPGVYSARYAGDNHDSQANMAKLLGKMENQENRKAQFRTVVSLIFRGEEHLFEGKVSGEITREKHGTEGFGYDPIFAPESSDGGKNVTFKGIKRNLTFAEMNDEAKNAISHRGRAMEKLAKFFAN